MRKQGQDVMQVNLAGIRRDIVNLAHNYSNAQVKMKFLHFLKSHRYSFSFYNKKKYFRKQYEKRRVTILGVQAVR